MFFGLGITKPKNLDSELVNDEENVTHFMMRVIKATVYNQDLANEHNLHTQYR